MNIITNRDLYSAIELDNEDEVRYLLLNGADPTAGIRQVGFTPLHAAMRTGNNRIINMIYSAIINTGFNPNIPDYSGMLPQDYYPNINFRYPTYNLPLQHEVPLDTLDYSIRRRYLPPSPTRHRRPPRMRRISQSSRQVSRQRSRSPRTPPNISPKSRPNQRTNLPNRNIFDSDDSDNSDNDAQSFIRNLRQNI